MTASGLILAALYQIVAIVAGLPVAELRPQDRCALGGLLTPLRPAVAYNVARGLLRRPDLFPEIPALDRGREILERLKRGEAWLALANILARWAQLARDGYLRETGTAIRDAVEILDRVKAERDYALSGTDDPALHARERCMGRALALLEADRKAGGRRGTNKEAAAGTGTAPPTEAAGAGHPGDHAGSQAPIQTSQAPAGTTGRPGIQPGQPRNRPRRPDQKALARKQRVAAHQADLRAAMAEAYQRE